jgi:hypothetical protein
MLAFAFFQASEGGECDGEAGTDSTTHKFFSAAAVSLAR